MMWRVYLVLLIAFAAQPSNAQWVPLSARMRETVEIHKATGVETRVRMGNFYRSSEGSTLEQWAANADDPQSIRVEYLVDIRSNAIYEAFHGSGVAIQRAPSSKFPAQPAQPIQLPKRGEARESEVAGRPCLAIPIFDVAGPGKPPVRTGESCWSNEYGLALKRETTRTDAKGNRVKTVMEYYDLIPHIEPDPKLFDLRARGYRVHKAEPGS